MQNSNNLQDTIAIANTFSGPVIIICCIIGSFFLLNPSDRSNILIGALGAGSAMWQHTSKRTDSTTISAASTEDGRGSGRAIEQEKSSTNL